MKTSVRKSFLARRNKLSKAFIDTCSAKIAHRLKNLHAFKKSSHILFYVSKDSEVDTHLLIRQLLKAGRKKIYVPYIKKGNPLLHISRLSDFNDLQKGSFDILEPRENKIQKCNPRKIELVLVPGIVFDKKGFRIGYGKGFYDRFLKKTKKALKIGLAFDFQLIDSIEREPHDIAMDMLITDKRII